MVDNKSKLKNFSRTRIICTIGPSSYDIQTLKQLIEAGMSVARINLSHGDSTEHKLIINNIRNASKELNRPIPILADLPGPKYRVGELETDQFICKNNQRIFFDSSDKLNKEIINIWPSGLHKDIKKGATLLIDDGAVELDVISIDKTLIETKVKLGGKISSNKAVVARGFPSMLGYFTDETTEALDFVLSNYIDFVGLSYIRNIDDIKKVKRKIESKNKSIKIISKIELKTAVDNLKSIINESDAVMVARGDLGVHLPISEIPSTQKFIIKVANSMGKEVITATQMLESMTENPQPTRAEVTDVHNAVIDGSDAIMLSGETSIGKFPVRSVEFMKEIAEIAEKNINNNYLRKLRFDHVTASNAQNIDEFIAHGAADIAEQLNAKLIVAFTESGSTAARVASYKPSKPVIALSPDPKAHISLSLRWGVYTIKAKNLSNIEEMFQFAEDMVSNEKLAKKGETIIVVAGLPIGFKGNTNLIRVITIK